MSDSTQVAPRGQQAMLFPGWTQPRNLSNSPGRAVSPVLLAGANDTVHALWEEDNRIYHTARRSGVWSAPASMATGFQPAASLASNGDVHLVFSSQFFGRYRVFHATWNGDYWSLPRLVSKTTGNATSPTVAIDKAGLVHAGWADTTPGFSLIYHGWLESTWLNEPIQNARGDIPTLASDPTHNQLFLTFQSPGISGGAREVFFSQGHVYSWPAPENISLSAGAESLNAALAPDGEGTVHVVWEEQSGNAARIRYRYGRLANWSEAEYLSDEGHNARQASIAVTQSSQVHVVWQQGPTLVYRRRFVGKEAWEAVTPLVANNGGIGDPVVAGAPDGGINLAWTGWASNSERDPFYSQHDPLLRPKVFVPGIVTGG